MVIHKALHGMTTGQITALTAETFKTNNEGYIQCHVIRLY